MADSNPYAAPKSAIRSSRRQGGSLWRDEELLVVRRGHRFETCTVCGGPGVWTKRRTVVWYPRWILLTLLINIIVTAIAYAVTSRRSQVEITLCEEHHQRRQRLWWGAVAAAVLSPGLMVLSVWAESGAIFVAGLVVMAGAAVAAWMANPWAVTAIGDNGAIWLKGIDEKVIRDLPPVQFTRDGRDPEDFEEADDLARFGLE